MSGYRELAGDYGNEIVSAQKITENDRKQSAKKDRTYSVNSSKKDNFPK